MRPARLIPAGVLVIGVSYGLARYTYGLFVPNIRSELGVSTEVLGLIASGSYAGYLAASVITAVIAAKTGPRLPVVIGALCAATGMLVIGLSVGPGLLAVGVVLAGMSPGFAYTPFSDAVVRLVPEGRQNRTYAIINSGTSFGVLVAGPVALWVGEAWRTAWLLFAALALVAAIWNGYLLPSGPHQSTNSRSKNPEPNPALPALRWRWFVGRKSGRLFTVALILGVTTSIYWTFAVDLIVAAVSDNSGTSANGAAFWTLVGVSGVVGAFAGDIVIRFGLKRSLLLGILALTGATALLAAFPANWWGIVLSAVVFGAAFIAVTGILGVWSINVFYDRPSAGFGATFFLISAGQLIGPSAFALISGRIGLVGAFYVAAAITAAAAILKPRSDLRSMTPKDSRATDDDSPNFGSKI